MNSFSRVSVSILALLLSCIVGCSGAKPQPTEAATAAEQSKPDWVNEEILLQLKEIHKEIADLKSTNSKDIQDLRVAVTKLEEKVNGAGGAAVARGAAPAEIVPKEVKLAGAPVLGSAGAKIAIVEFSDFQCPYCARHYNQAFGEIRKKWVDTGKVKYVAHAYPLSFHNQAKGAAVAALCAGNAGSYWQMHDSLFRNSQRLGADFYLKEASALHLDQKRFSSCLNNSESGELVDAEVAYGSSLGVSGTPKFFVGRVSGDKLVDVTVINGAQSYAAFAAAIESKLQKGG